MATCAECVHVEVCTNFAKMILDAFDVSEDDAQCLLKKCTGDATVCNDFADRSRFVELPCKVGDTVYVVENIAGEKKIIQDSVETIGIGYYAEGIEIYQFDGIKTDGYFSDFGKTVFLTKEAAEQALKEREEDEGKGAGVSVGGGEACDRGRAAE